MGKLIHRTGNIFETEALVLGHGVNTQGGETHGIAPQFWARYPDMETVWQELCTSGQLEPGGVFAYGPSALDGRTILNIATQDRPGGGAKYKWLGEGVSTALSIVDHHELGVLALPRLGSGIGGLNADVVEEVLEQIVSVYQSDIELWTWGGSGLRKAETL